MSLLLWAGIALGAALSGAPDTTSFRFGTSALGRPLRVERTGGRPAHRPVLVFGCIHGDECAGSAVTRALTRMATNELWVVNDLNPDGRRIGTRLNGRGVDLNRNFPVDWRPIGSRWDPQHSGPRPFSEPESRAARRLIRALRPRLTVWYHQQAQPLVRAWGPSIPAARAYARTSGLPFVAMPWMDGTAPNWQNNEFAGSASFVVELPRGRLAAGAVRRHVRAVAGIR